MPFVPCLAFLIKAIRSTPKDTYLSTDIGRYPRRFRYQGQSNEPKGMRRAVTV